MYIQQNKTNKKKIYLIAAAVITMGVLSYGLTARYYSLWPFTNTTKTNLGPVSTQERTTGNQIKSNSVDTKPNETKTSGSDQPLPPVATPNATTSTALVDITAASQDGQTYHIRSLIQAVLNSGQCTLTMTNKSNQTYTATASIQALPSTSTCTGFDIPVANLSPGVWNVKINISSGSIIGQATKEVTIQ